MALCLHSMAVAQKASLVPGMDAHLTAKQFCTTQGGVLVMVQAESSQLSRMLVAQSAPLTPKTPNPNGSCGSAGGWLCSRSNVIMHLHGKGLSRAPSSLPHAQLATIPKL